MEECGSHDREARDDEEFDTEAAAVFLNCSPGYLCNLRSWGSGPYYHRKFKRRGIFYLGADLKAFKLRNRYSSSTEY